MAAYALSYELCVFVLSLYFIFFILYVFVFYFFEWTYALLIIVFLSTTVQMLLNQFQLITCIRYTHTDYIKYIFK